MYERFTDRARKIMELANQAAQLLNHEYITSEHILSGIAISDGGVAKTALKNLGVEPDQIKAAIAEKFKPRPENGMSGVRPQTPGAKKVIEYAIQHARDLNHNYVGSEHILLGLMTDPNEGAAIILSGFGLRIEKVRQEILRMLGDSANQAPVISDAAIAKKLGGDDRTK